jgi:membrane-bound ClpP family serine protease
MSETEEKMGFLINPNIAYLLIVAAVVLYLMTTIFPKSTVAKVGMVFCLGAAGYEIVYFHGNFWALIVTALSPLPFFMAIRQKRMHLPLLIITILMLTVGSVFLIVDKSGISAVNYLLAGGVSIFCGEFIWIALGRTQNVQGIRLSDNPNSMVGLTGKTQTEIEIHSTGSVEVEGELWMARSEKNIPVGSMVRILRQDGAVLTVKKAEKLTKE